MMYGDCIDPREEWKALEEYEKSVNLVTDSGFIQELKDQLLRCGYFGSVEVFATVHFFHMELEDEYGRAQLYPVRLATLRIRLESENEHKRLQKFCSDLDVDERTKPDGDVRVRSTSAQAFMDALRAHPSSGVYEAVADQLNRMKVQVAA